MLTQLCQLESLEVLPWQRLTPQVLKSRNHTISYLYHSKKGWFLDNDCLYIFVPGQQKFEIDRRIPKNEQGSQYDTGMPQMSHEPDLAEAEDPALGARATKRTIDKDFQTMFRSLQPV